MDQKNSSAPQPEKNSSETNLRFFQRAPLSVPIAYKVLRNAKNQPVVCEGQMGLTMDVSAAGMKILTREELALNTIAQIALDFYANDQPFIIDCRVVRCIPSKEKGFFELGLMYLSISAEERRRMNAYVAAHTKTA